MAGVVGTAHSCSNPNSTVWSSKGIWLTYVSVILLVHIVIISIPGNCLKTTDFYTPVNNKSFLNLKVILCPPKSASLKQKSVQ
jgi:hypothetical protein